MKNKVETDGAELYLTGSNNNVVNRDKDELHEKSYESHNHESDRCTERHLRKFWNQKKKTNLSIRFLIDQQNLIIGRKKEGEMSNLSDRACGISWRDEHCP